MNIIIMLCFVLYRKNMAHIHKKLNDVYGYDAESQ